MIQAKQNNSSHSDDKIQVLFVDDETSILNSLRRLFRGNEYQVYCADSADKGLEILEQHEIQVIVSDMRMPGMTGVEFLTLCAKKWPYAARIVLTGHEDLGQAIKAINQGHIYRYLNKPWDNKQLVNTIRTAFSHQLHLCQQKQIGDLPNRPLFLARVDYILTHEKKPADEFALLVIHIDNIKKYNDSLGHTMGDKILTTLIQRISLCLNDHDLLARLDGDELGLLTLFSSIHPLIGQIQSAIRQPLVMNNMNINLTASIGISLSPQHGANAHKLLQNSSTSMNAQKARGGDGFSVYAPDMSNLIRQRMEIENDLRQAVEMQQLRVVYQPKYNLEKAVIESAEALLRWQHPQKGLIPPDIFIPIAEETGLINCIGEWVLHQVIEDINQWRQQGFKPICCAVNISVVQMQDQQLARIIKQLLQKKSLPSKWIELELTESMAILGQEQILNTLFKLKKMGLNLSIDDFGTGYSALSYLKQLPVDALKIDRCFITDLTKSSEDEELVKNIINMAHGMGLKVIAEGVETLEQLDKLDEMGCDSIQGFVLSHPLAQENFVKLLIPK